MVGSFFCLFFFSSRLVSYNCNMLLIIFFLLTIVQMESWNWSQWTLTTVFYCIALLRYLGIFIMTFVFSLFQSSFLVAFWMCLLFFYLMPWWFYNWCQVCTWIGWWRRWSPFDSGKMSRYVHVNELPSFISPSSLFAK